jgi:hypothetical protein
VELKELQAWMLEQFNEVNRKLDAAIEGISKPRTAAKAKPVSGIQEAIARYCDLYRARYKTDKNPHLLVKDRGHLQNLIKTAGLDRTLEILEAYFTSDDYRFTQKKHDVPTLIYNLNQVTLLADTGIVESAMPRFKGPPAGPDWDKEASIMIAAVRRYPEGDASIQAHLGERWPLYLKIGRAFIRSLEDNTFGRRELANKIKSMSEGV